MADADEERLILPPPLPTPNIVSRRTIVRYALTARIAHIMAHDGLRAFDTGDRDRLLQSLDALVELVSESNSRRP